MAAQTSSHLIPYSIGYKDDTMYTSVYMYGCVNMHVIAVSYLPILNFYTATLNSWYLLSIPPRDTAVSTAPRSTAFADIKVSRHAAGEQLPLRSQAHCGKNSERQLWEVPEGLAEVHLQVCPLQVKPKCRLLLAPVQLICPPTHRNALSRNPAPPISVPRQPL